MKTKLYTVAKVLTALLIAVISLYCFKLITDTNVIPNMELISLLIIVIIINLLAAVGLFIKKIWGTVVSLILYIVLVTVSIVGIIYLIK